MPERSVTFRPSRRYQAAKMLPFIPWVAVGVIRSRPVMVAPVLVWVAFYWLAAVANVRLSGTPTTVSASRIRGAQSLRRRWSVRPPGLGMIESVSVAPRWFARVVIVEATDDDGVRFRWALDAPRALRWGRDEGFDADVDVLRQLWREATSGTPHG